MVEKRIIDENEVNLLLLGNNPQNIDTNSFEKPVHSMIVPALKKLQAQARADGFDLRLASGYRSFDQQARIWNDKAQGRRPVLDHEEKEIDIFALLPKDRVFAILRWSALPGASRHHWGTDIDVYDAAALGSGQSFKLTVAETEKGGVFEDFYQWLDSALAQGALPFYRPYARDRGGVAPEPWHLSYAPLASELTARYSKALMRRCIEKCSIELKAVVLDNIDEIYQRFVINVD